MWRAFGPSVTYDVARGTLAGLRAGVPAACLSTGQSVAFHDDQAEPTPSEIYYYLIRAQNLCGKGPWGDDNARTSVCP